MTSTSTSWHPCRRLLVLLISLFHPCLAFFTASTNVRSAVVTTTVENNKIIGSVGRDYCSGCQRPPPQCLCDILPRQKIRLDTQLLILQHPAEFRRSTISTVPILKSVLEDCQVLVGRSFHNNNYWQVEKIIDDACQSSGGRIPLLLFPGPNAIVLDDSNSAMNQIRASSFSSSSSPSSSSLSPPTYLLIVVDGTWTQAKRMLRNSPMLLERCQLVQFIGTNITSIYDSIRKQPDSNCLSTLESCERAMRLLEPNNPQMKKASYYLLEALRAMILIQMKYERMNLEQHPDSIRNMEKLMAKKQRQQQLIHERSMISTHHTINNITTSLPSGYYLRPLVESDAKYVDSRWPFRSKRSLVMIEKQILGDTMNATKYGCSICLGIEFDNRLVGCIMRHQNGSIGILHVDEEHRRVGLGQALLYAATRALACRNEEVFAFIIDGNHASETLFTKLGWEKISSSRTGKRRVKGKWMYSLEEAREGTT